MLLVLLCLLFRRTIMDDPFIRQYVEDLLTKIRTQVCEGEHCFPLISSAHQLSKLGKVGAAQPGNTRSSQPHARRLPGC